MGRIIRFDRDDHRDAQLHLTWFATGRLDPMEHARVEAHLSICAECQADLKLERRLLAEVAELRVEAGVGWEALRGRLTPRRSRAATPPARRAAGRRWTPWTWQGWAVAAQFVLLLVLGAALVAPQVQPRYRALGARTAPAAGNLIVMFHPETPEAGLRRTISAAGARLVDGPTPAGAYVLSVAKGDRPQALAQLRRDPQILMAEPIDPAGAP